MTVYKQVGGDQPEEPIERRELDLDSEKPLTGNHARRILRRTFPELGYLHSLTRKNGCWWTSRAVQAMERCGYHYVWHHYYIQEARQSVER